MTLTIDLKPELEAQLREEAAKSGMDASTFVVQALQERLQSKSRLRLPASVKQTIRKRARNRCEYCRSQGRNYN